MKKFLVAGLVSIAALSSETTAREKYVIFNIDVTGTTTLQEQQLGNVLRMHFEKLDSFEAVDRYEMTALEGQMGTTKLAYGGTVEGKIPGHAAAIWFYHPARQPG